MAYGKSVNLFLVNGKADSLIVATLSNWNATALKIPRIEVSNCGRSELQHIQDYNSEKEKYYWNSAICFTGPMLNKTLVRYLEKRAFEIARDVKRYEILTVQTFSNTVISEYDKAAMEEFLNNMKIVLGTLGCEALEPLDIQVGDDKDDIDRRFYASVGNVMAEGEITAEGFVI